MGVREPFDTLGLSADAGVDDVRAARRRLAKDHHPDQGGDPERMRQINEAADAALAAIARAATAAGDAHDTASQSGRQPGASGADRRQSETGVRRGGDHEPGDSRQVVRDTPSFTVEALPVETFEALLVVASWLGEVLDDEPPYRLDTYLFDPFDCWCRLEVVPDAGASTVSLTVASIDGERAPDVVAVRDAWVADLNRVDWP